jgi:hypothetical protein
VGTPIGVAIVKSIGAGGGSLISGDGVLTVVVPAGAVSSATDFSIQPITGPGGSRVTAYRLLPDGAKFPTPVTLTFAYTDDEVGDSDPEGLGIAYQDANGVWRAMLASTVNTAAHTVSVATTHFTDHSKWKFWTIVPANAIVKTQEQLPLFVYTCVSETAANEANDPPVTVTGLDDDLAALPPCGVPSKWTGSWAVSPGNGTAGSVVAGSPSSRATYTAPANQPNPRVVSVTATMRWPARGLTKKLTSKVTVGGPEVHVVGTYAGEDIIGVYILSNVTDRVEFDLALTGQSANGVNVTNTTSKHEGDKLRQPSEACGFTITGTFEWATFTDVSAHSTPTGQVETTLSGSADFPAHIVRFRSLSGCNVTSDILAESTAALPVTFVFDPATLTSVGSSVQVRGLPGNVPFLHPENWSFTVTRTK